MRRAFPALLAALGWVALPALAALPTLAALPAAANELVGVATRRNQLVTVQRKSDPAIGRPFPFGGAPELASTGDFAVPDRVLITAAGDRVLLLDPQNDLLYAVDPFTGEHELILHLHRPNRGAWSKPGKDFDGDLIPNEQDLCPEHARICEGGPNPGAKCATDARCTDGVSAGACVSVSQDDLDGDGVGDVCDNCPETPNPRIAELDRPFYQTTTGGQPDSDRDGIGDVCDCDFTMNGTVCSEADLARTSEALGDRVDRPESCLNASGNPGPCAPYDVDGVGWVVSAGDLVDVVAGLGTEPEPCPVCPYRCSGPNCSSVRVFADAITWDPVGGPVNSTEEGLVPRPRLFISTSVPVGQAVLFATQLEGPRAFVLYPYANLSETARALAFDPYHPIGTNRKTLYGANIFFFFKVKIGLIDSLVSPTTTLPILDDVDLAAAKQISMFLPPIEGNPVVTDDSLTCRSFRVTLETESCDPSSQEESVFWSDDRCRTLPFCSCSGEDCGRAYPDLESCYNVQRICVDYCSPFELGGEPGCPAGSELSGVTWDGEACVPFDGCCDGPDCNVVFPDAEACGQAFLTPRELDLDSYPVAPCPNFYARPSCEPDAVGVECAPDDPRSTDGIFWTGFRCENRVAFCCEGEDCDDAFFPYNPPPETDPGADKATARFECWKRHLRCPGFCEEFSSLRSTPDPGQCVAGETFVNGWMLGTKNDFAGLRRECVRARGCCTGPDCAAIAPSNPNEPVNTATQCFNANLLCIGFAESLRVIFSLNYENAGAFRGRLIGADQDGNLICLNPAFNAAFPGPIPVSGRVVNLPEKFLRQATLIANFDVTDDGQVDIEDVCEVEAAVLAEELPCDPTGVGDPSYGPCADYPGGECSTTRDLNRDTLLNEDDLSLIERRVGMSCDGSPVGP